MFDLFVDKQADRGEVGPDGTYKPGYGDLLNLAYALHSEREYYQPRSQSINLWKEEGRSALAGKSSYKLPAESREEWLLATMEKMDQSAQYHAAPPELSSAISDPWLRDRLLVAELHAEGIIEGEIHYDNFTKQDWTEEESRAENGQASIDAMKAAHAEALAIGDESLAKTVEDENPAYGSLEIDFPPSSHIPSFKDAPVTDPKVRNLPARMPSSQDMKELKEALPPGISPGQSGYSKRYKG